MANVKPREHSSTSNTFPEVLNRSAMKFLCINGILLFISIAILGYAESTNHVQERSLLKKPLLGQLTEDLDLDTTVPAAPALPASPAAPSTPTAPQKPNTATNVGSNEKGTRVETSNADVSLGNLL